MFVIVGRDSLCGQYIISITPTDNTITYHVLRIGNSVIDYQLSFYADNEFLYLHSTVGSGNLAAVIIETKDNIEFWSGDISTKTKLTISDD